MQKALVDSLQRTLQMLQSMSTSSEEKKTGACEESCLIMILLIAQLKRLQDFSQNSQGCGLLCRKPFDKACSTNWQMQ